MFDIIKVKPGDKYKIDVSYFDFRPMLHQRLIDKFLDRHLERDANWWYVCYQDHKWYVCYQDEGKDMTGSSHLNEKDATKSYEKYKGKKARMLCN